MQTPVEATLSLDGAQSTNSDAVMAYAFVGLLDAQHDVAIEKDDGINESIGDASRIKPCGGCGAAALH